MNADHPRAGIAPLTEGDQYLVRRAARAVGDAIRVARGIASFYAAAGENATALDWLERAYANVTERWCGSRCTRDSTG